MNIFNFITKKKPALIASFALDNIEQVTSKRSNQIITRPTYQGSSYQNAIKQPTELHIKGDISHQPPATLVDNMLNSGIGLVANHLGRAGTIGLKVLKEYRAITEPKLIDSRGNQQLIKMIKQLESHELLTIETPQGTFRNMIIKQLIANTSEQYGHQIISVDLILNEALIVESEQSAALGLIGKIL